MDAPCLLFDIRSKLLRLLTSSAGKNFEGLGQASRYQQFGFSSKQKRQLQNLDTAFNIIRHINEVKCEELLCDIQHTLEIPPSDVGAAPSSTEDQPIGMTYRMPTSGVEVDSTITAERDTSIQESTVTDEYLQLPPWTPSVHHQSTDSRAPCVSGRVEYVCETTGIITTPREFSQHIATSAQKDIIPAPTKDADTPSIIGGVNTNDNHPSQRKESDMRSLQYTLASFPSPGKPMKCQECHDTGWVSKFSTCSSCF